MATQTLSSATALCVPRATYRFQFNEHFKLTEALALVPYLNALGISHVYASPLFAARPHSGHGYDVCDFNLLNPELGTEADLEKLVMELRKHGMGLVLDIVPNHMGIGGPENQWWWDVLTNGPASGYASYFDVDWQSQDPRLRGKVLAPVLGDRYENVLGRGELHLEHPQNEYVLRYFEQHFPVTRQSLPDRLVRNGAHHPATIAALQELNANPQALDQVVKQQNYLLADWHEANTGLNYRRFFNIQTLAGLRMEDSNVFKSTHALLKRWLQAGWLDGIRVDHPDGLRDPEEYLQRLRGIAPNAWIVVEKILQPGEELPASWPVAGTTGYDFLNRVAGLFIDADGEKPFTDLYAGFTGESVDYAAMVLDQKRRILREMLQAEVNRITGIAVQIAAKVNHNHFTREQLHDGIVEIAAALPVYRTYARCEKAPLRDVDKKVIEETIAKSRMQRPDLSGTLFDFLGGILLQARHGPLECDFVMRFQQLTCSTMAKGVEDTAFYCFNRLTALNEVGGNPGCYGFSVESFHKSCRQSVEHQPDAMLATSTHDTKRSEDTRARLCALSEIPKQWNDAVQKWSAMNQRHRHNNWPDRNAEWLFYQTLVAAWPISTERAWAYMEKAVREAKQHTSFDQPNKEYETALHDFVTASLDDGEFRRDLERFVAPLVDAGYTNSLAQTLIKLTAPGVPDIYQGCELWDFSLVDPDNRRPVDFEVRKHLLGELNHLSFEEAWKRRSEGLPKLWVIQKTLAFRAAHSELFMGKSSYEPLGADGAKAQHVVAFARGSNVITVIPRLVLKLGNDWADTTLEIPPGDWRNIFTGERISGGAAPLASLLQGFPVALLARKEKK